MPADDKSRFRQRLRDARRSLNSKVVAGVAIWDSVQKLPEWQAARSVLFYVDVRGEVPTQTALREELLQGDRRVGLPWCDGDELRATHILSMDELRLGQFNIPEPRDEVRLNPERQLTAADFDLIIVPGVGFDRRGQRLGSGRGYYDRFLEDAGSGTKLCGLGFDCQMVECIPTEPHDRRMDLIVTETRLLRFV